MSEIDINNNQEKFNKMLKTFNLFNATIYFLSKFLCANSFPSSTPN